MGQRYAAALRYLAEGDPSMARSLLEGVVAERPEFAGAWLDLALATYRSGDAVAALEHLEYLSSRFVLPQVISDQVAYLRRQWEQGDGSGAGEVWRGEILIGLGYDSNANTGLSPRTIPLTIDGVIGEFPVASAYLPRSDAFARLAVSAWGPGWALGEGKLTPVVAVSTRQFASENDFSSIDLQSGLAYRTLAGESGTWLATLFGQYYQLGADGLFSGLRLGLQRLHPVRACQLVGFGEIEYRHHLQVDVLSGVIYNLGGQVACPTPGRASLTATARVSRDEPTGDRAGGGNTAGEVSLRYRQLIGDAYRWQAEWLYANGRDDEGYSPLIDDNARRRLNRRTLAIGVYRMFGRNWEAGLLVESTRQDSNVPLFVQSGNIVQMTLRRPFD